MDKDRIRYEITKLDVYELQNRLLDNQNAWCSTSNEDARDRLYWWQGVIDTIRELLLLFEEESDKVPDKLPGVENE